MYKFLLIFCLSMNLSHASALKLVDYVISGSGIEDLLVRNGMKSTEAKEAEAYVNSSLKKLNANGKKLSKEELLILLSKSEDTKVKNALQALLDTPPEKIKRADLINAINHITYLEKRYGALGLTCEMCINESAEKIGFRIKDPVQLNTFLTVEFKKQGIDFAKTDPALVAPEEQSQLAFFLDLKVNGTPEQKDLVRAIERASTKNGKVNVIDPKNPHKLWKIPSAKMASEDMRQWTDFINDIADKEVKENILTEEAYKRYLKEKAGDNPELMKVADEIIAKGCFLKKKV